MFNKNENAGDSYSITGRCMLIGRGGSSVFKRHKLLQQRIASSMHQVPNRGGFRFYLMVPPRHFLTCHVLAVRCSVKDNNSRQTSQTTYSSISPCKYNATQQNKSVLLVESTHSFPSFNFLLALIVTWGQDIESMEYFIVACSFHQGILQLTLMNKALMGLSVKFSWIKIG